MSAVLPDARVNKNLEGPGARARIQKFGGYLAGMIMPNIGAFIAWGLITALFIPTGWAPNESLAKLVGPIITYLLPVLIGYTGGRMVHAQRGAVIGAIATMGVVVGADVPMFLGAMIIGPLAAFVLKVLDKSIEGKVPSGFEMLVDNFSLGILGGVMAVIGRLGIGPVVSAIVGWLGSGVQALVNAGLLPVASIFVEPAKVLFLNNAINHGVLSPLGAAQAQELGKSILFMVESNPGPGLGLLLAYMFFGPKSLRPSTPGAIIIHFFGGIHEIYFPYVLMKPKMILATIAGGATGLLVGGMFGAGLVAPASPGSILAYFAVTPKGGYLAMLASVIAATGVSLLVGALLLGFGRGERDEPLTTPEAAAETAGAPVGTHPLVNAAPVADTPAQATHREGIVTVAGTAAPATAVPASAAVPAAAATATAASHASVNTADVKKLIIACDAGMGSSAMVAAAMRKKLKPYGVEVEHTPVNSIPTDAKLIMCHTGLVDRARGFANPMAVIVPFSTYVGDPAFAQVEAAFKNGETIE